MFKLIDSFAVAVKRNIEIFKAGLRLNHFNITFEKFEDVPVYTNNELVTLKTGVVGEEPNIVTCLMNGERVFVVNEAFRSELTKDTQQAMKAILLAYVADELVEAREEIGIVKMLLGKRKRIEHQHMLEAHRIATIKGYDATKALQEFLGLLSPDLQERGRDFYQLQVG